MDASMNKSKSYSQPTTNLVSNETVHIKIKVDNAFFEFECDARDATKITNEIVNFLQKLGAKQISQTTKKYRCLEECIRDLIDKGWFVTPRTLGEICELIRKLGYNYNTGYVSHVLKHYHDKGILLRLGTQRRYLYKEARR
jgi:hypothetical protein